MWQFKFVCCPQFLEISSVAHQLSCFGVGFLVCWLTGGLFLCLSSFLWGKVGDQSPSPLLSACCDGLLIVFQFCSVICPWMLLTCSGDELCRLLPAYFRQRLITGLLLAFLLFQPLFTEISCRDQLLAPPPFSGALSGLQPLLLCASFQFIAYLGFFFFGRGVSLPRELYMFIPGGILNDAWCSHVLYAEYLPNSFGAGIWQWQ
jgi:hypothetical protein